MVAKLEDFTFSRGKGENYPWDEWTDGSIYRAIRGEDFAVPPNECTLASFQTSMHQRAAKLTKTRQIRVRCQTAQESEEIDGVVRESLVFRFTEFPDAPLPAFAKKGQAARAAQETAPETVEKPKPKKKKKG